MLRTLPIVGVMGSGTDDGGPPAAALGRALAGLRVHLVTGGGRGVMTTVSRAFAEVADREGLVIGVVPCRSGTDPTPKDGYPNAWVEVAIRTHLPLSGNRGQDPMSRNHVNVLTSDVVIALRGGAGTCSEVDLARRYGRPAVWFLPDHEGGPVLDGVPVTRTLEGVLEFVQRHAS